MAGESGITQRGFDWGVFFLLSLYKYTHTHAPPPQMAPPRSGAN
jgi:hypothetical protein